MQPVSDLDRLSALDSLFLQLEDAGAHMHVAAILIFEGEAPTHAEFIAQVLSRLHLVPRYRQRLARVPFGQARPVWADDPHFNPGYHIRHVALPRPGSDQELKRLAGRVFAQGLDRTKPLWELYLVEGLAPAADGSPRFALINKTHHALVDGVSGVDLTAVMFDLGPTPAPIPPPESEWVPKPAPTGTELLVDTLRDGAKVPVDAARGLLGIARAPRKALADVGKGLAGVGAVARSGMSPAPATPFNVATGPHRRYTWVDGDLEEFKRIKNALGGTINDVVLTAVTLGLGDWLRSEGHEIDGLVLRAMIPVSVRAEDERGALGNRVASMWAPLPVGIRDPARCFTAVHEAMSVLKRSGQAVGAQALTQLADFAPPTIMSQAARLQSRRLFNLVVTNVPGPQFPLYLLGRKLDTMYPVVPLARRQALGIAIFSYAGHLGFGLLADYDALPGLEDIGARLEGAISALADTAAEPGSPHPRRAPRAPGRRRIAAPAASGR
jgi:WS/DGAT/MGAT family acyltransferase